MKTATDLLLWGVVAHLIADWLLQDSWQAKNKVSLRHPAAWVHGGIHFFVLAYVFPLPAALGLAAIHMLVDTRVPLTWWRKFYGQTSMLSTQEMQQIEHDNLTEHIMGSHVAIWTDQVVHIVCIAIAALLCAPL